jgi:hypothetical protein
VQIAKRGEFFKAEGKLVYGWALVCEERVDGEWSPYIDTQGDHIPEDAMVEAAIEFAKNSRTGLDMHAGEPAGSVPLVYVITRGSSALGIESTKTGMLIGWEPNDPELLKAIAAGERTGFSIGGEILESDRDLAKFAKAEDAAADGGAPTKPRVFRRFRIDEISLVDRPAMEGATIAYVKRDARNSTPATPARKVSTMNEDEYKAKIAELEAKLAEMTPAEKAEGVAGMTLEQALARIAELEAAEAAKAAPVEPKVEDVAKAADPVLLSLADGTVVRKSDGPAALAMGEALKKAHDAIAKERKERADIELAKRATDTIGALAGKSETHVELMRLVETLDTAKRADALATLKAANDLMASRAVAPGVGGQGEPVVEAPIAKFNAARDVFAKAKGKTPAAATIDFLRTPEGAELYAATLPQAAK